MSSDDGRPRRPSFTGVVRVRRTSRRVAIVDKIARFAITGGGLLTIGAVALVCFFLLAVALPLLGSGHVTAAPSLHRAVAADVVRFGEHPRREHCYTLERGGDLVVMATRDGREVTRQRAFVPDGVRCVDVRGDRVLLGRDDGSVQFVTIEFGSVDSEAPVRARLDDPVALGSAAVVHADFADTGTGVAVVAITADGRLHTKIRTTRHDLAEDREIVEYTGASATLAEIVGDPSNTAPDHVWLVGRGDNVWAAWNDGRLLRIDTRDFERPVLAERLDLLADARTIRATTFLAGKSTLLVGDDRGDVRAWFLAKPPGATTADRATLVCAHVYTGHDSPVVALEASTRSRLFVAGHADGTVRVWQATTERSIAKARTAAGEPMTAVAIAPKEDGIAAIGALVHRWDLDAGHPEATFATTFTPIWYEGSAGPEHVWQSTGGADDFEPKLGLWPLIWGTLKASFYCLLFGVPLALLAALYSSEFLHAKTRARVKPAIELMASLPSVVLGFLAGLVIAAFVAEHLVQVLLSLLVVPFVLMVAAQGWQQLPPKLRPIADRWRVLAAIAAVPLGVWFAGLLAPLAENGLFGGDLKNWLAATPLPDGDPRRGSAFGGLLLVAMPIAACLTLLGLGRLPRRWSNAAAPVRFAIGCAATAAIAATIAGLATLTGFDLRGNLFGVFDPRNSLVVGLVMGFAVVPVVYTIAEDALSAVPEHLRAASLGAGASPWQTAVRVVLPTAASGVFSAVMVGVGRAVGETMIVVMAVGGTAIIDPSVFNGFRTLSANLATELPEAVRGSTHYRVLFLAALCLFAMTFVLNTIAEVVRQRSRRRAFQL